MSWKTIRLGDVAKVSSSKRIFARQYVEAGIPFYRQKEIIDKKNKVEITEPLFISQETYDDIKNKFGVPHCGDLLITAVGVTLGIPYVVDDEIFYFKDGNLIWLSNFDKQINSKYLYYWITSDKGQKSMWSRTIGSAQPALTIDTIKQFEIPVPHYATQCKIVDILSAYDDLIENNQKQIKLLEEAAQRLYKEWFIYLRFPGYEKVDTVNGMPEGWKKDKADTFFNISIGKTPPRAEKQWFVEGKEGLPWLSISDMGNSGTYIFETNEGLTEEAVTKHNMKVVSAGTIFVSFKLTVGRVAIATTDMCTNEAISHFHISDEKVRPYAYCYLNNFEYDTLGNTSSISKAVNSKIIKTMPFVMPTEKIVLAFSEQVEPIMNAIKNKQGAIIKLTEARDRLLPKLMSGEREV